MSVANASIKRLGLDGISKKDMFGIEPHLLDVEEGFNLRLELRRDHIEGFKRTLRAGGTIPPLEVRGTADKRVFVVDGHHRRAAILELIQEGFEIKRVDCVAHQGNDADRVATMLTSSQGLPLTPLEQGLGYRRLQRFGWTTKEIAERVNRSVLRVEQLVLLAEADVSVQDLVRTEKVSVEVVIDTLKKHGSDAGRVLADMVKKVERTGTRKVTKSVAQGRAVPKKVITAVAVQLSEATATVPSEAMDVIRTAQAMPPDARAGMAVMVPVDVMIALIGAESMLAAAKNAPTEAAAGETPKG